MLLVMIMLKLDGVRKKYKSKKIFDKVCLEITHPGLYLVKGKNGSGKTTLFNVLGGFIKFKGRVYNPFKCNMSYMFQNSYLIEHFTIKEHFEIFNIDLKLLDNFNLQDKLECLPKTLSSGEKQRIALLLALHSERDLILLDEPFANLDKKNILIALNIINKIKKNAIILLISHDNNLINKIDGVINVNNGKVKLKLVNKSNDSFKNRKIKKVTLKNDFKYYKREYLKLYFLITIIFFLLFSFSISKIIIDKVIVNDIENSVDYNKFYLKECREVSNGGFTISKCSNPSNENLNFLKKEGVEYKYNYDYILSYFFNNENLSVMNNIDIKLKSGKYPENFYEVLANDNYELGDVIKVDVNLVVKDKKSDVYKETIFFYVRGIYSDLTFYKEEKIYLDYDYLDLYLKNTILKNNNYSIYDYFFKLDVDNYKYLTFNKIETDNIIFEGAKYSYYDNLNLLVEKIYDLAYKIEIFFILFLIYNFFKTIKFLLIKKQKSIAFYIANSFNKNKLIFREFILCFSVVFFIVSLGVILAMFIFKNMGFTIKILLVFSLIFCIELISVNMFFSRKRIAKLMREEIW